MRREFVIGGIFLLIFMVLMASITYWGNQDDTITKTSVIVEEGRVEVSNALDSNDKKTLGPNQSINASSGELQAVENIIPTTLDATSIAGAASMGAAAINNASNDECWIAGYVRGEDDKKLTGVEIRVRIVDGVEQGVTYDASDGDENIKTTKTDQEGYYTITLDEPHEFQISSTPSEGYLKLVERVTLTEESRTLAKHFVHPIAAFSVHGKVLDKETEEPIEGADVVLLMQHPNVHPQQKIERAKTNEHGEYTITRVAKGTFRLEANKEGYVKFSPYGKKLGDTHPLLNFQVTESTQNKEYIIKMEPGSTARFKVVDANDKPVPKVNVKVMRDTQYFSYVDGCMTNEDGEAENDRLPKETLIAEASHEEFGKGRSKKFEPGSADDPPLIEIVLQETGSISGKVTDADGNLMEGISINAAYIAQDMDMENVNEENTQTGVDGLYSITSLSAGTYRVFVSNNSYGVNAGKVKTIELQGGVDRTGVDFTLGKMVELRGKVINQDDEPIEDIYVSAVTYLKDGSMPGSGSDQTDENGEFHVKDAPPGYEVQYQLQGKGYAHTIIRHPMDGEYKIIKMKSAGTVKGVVLNTEGEPIEGAQVYPIRMLSDSPYHNKYQTVNTGIDGSFEFTSLDPMDYRFCASAEGYVQKESAIVSLDQEENIDSVIIELETGLEITGRVVDPNGQPLPNALISLLSLTINNNSGNWSSSHFDMNSFPETAKSDPEGNFVITDFPPDGDTLIVQYQGLAPLRFQIVPAMLDQQPFTIQLTEGGTIEGLVLDQTKSPVSGAEIRVQNFPENMYRQVAKTDSKGEYRIEHLAPMSYMVSKVVSVYAKNTNQSFVSNGPGRDDSQFVAVEEGQIVRADFGAGEGADVRGTVYKRGEPIAGAQLAIQRVGATGDSNGFFMNVIADEQGAFVFNSIPEGEYTLFATTKPSSHFDISSAETYAKLDISADQDEYFQDLYIATYEIQGTVIDAESGEPVVGATIQSNLNAGETNVPVTRGARLNAFSDEEGRFILHPQEAGEFNLIALADKYSPEEFSITVEAAEQGSAAPSQQVQVAMKKNAMAVIAHLIYNGKPAFCSWAQFRGQTVYGGNRIIETNIEPGVYRLVGLPEGDAEFGVSAYVNNKVLSSNPQKVTLNNGQGTEVTMHLFETARYTLIIETPDNELLTSTATAEVLDFPEPFIKQIPLGRYTDTTGNNLARLEIPTTSRRVLFSVPGFWPVEFDPVAMAVEEVEAPEKKITIKLTPQ
jgi:carboxypeptidase family protein